MAEAEPAAPGEPPPDSRTGLLRRELTLPDGRYLIAYEAAPAPGPDA